MTPKVFILVIFFVSTGLADDFKTINGREYKNAKVSRVEPDGIVITFSGGISQSSSAATSINRATSLKCDRGMMIGDSND